MKDIASRKYEKPEVMLQKTLEYLEGVLERGEAADWSKAPRYAQGVIALHLVEALYINPEKYGLPKEAPQLTS